MQLGMIGLGRMGANMVRRLMRGGHTCVAYDRVPQAIAALEQEGAQGASSLATFVRKLAWLLDLTADALAADPRLGQFGRQVADSGEGRWTVQAANDEGVPAHVLTAALFERFASRDLDLFQNKVLSAMRFGFGGHVETR